MAKDRRIRGYKIDEHKPMGAFGTILVCIMIGLLIGLTAKVIGLF